jgi:uncharacterized protein
MKSKYLFTNKKSSRFVITIVTALIGGALFMLINMPIPWLLGPMIAVLIGSSIWKTSYGWPGQIRNTGMIIVGYTIGLSMTATALREMSHQLPSMLLMTMLLLLLCAGMAYVFSKLARSDYLTVLMGSIPGGLTQIITLAQETDEVNITIVTVMQVIRLMTIIVCVPLLIFSPLSGNQHADVLAAELISVVQTNGISLMPNLLIFAAVCVVFALAGSKIRFPTAYLLGPAIATVILQIIGLHRPSLPSILINAAQFMIGAYVGLLLKPGELTQKLRTISLAIISSILLVAGALGFSFILTKLQPVSMSTAILSLAPGGMDQMGIIAHEVNADLSMVSGYQLFRTFFIFFAIPPLLRLIINIARRRTLKEKN